MDHKIVQRRYRLLAWIFVLACVAAAIVFCTPRVYAEQGTAEARTPADLWATDGSMTLEANVDLPDRLLSGYENHNGIYEYVSADDLAAWQKNGVRVTVTNENDTLEYKNIIDLNTVTKNVPIIEIMPVSSNPIYSFDFSSMEITLTDADNPDNWFSVLWSTYELAEINESNLFACTSDVSVYTSTGVHKGLQYGWNPDSALDFTTWGSGQIWSKNGGGFTQLYSPFHNSTFPQSAPAGTKIADMRVLPLSFSFDTEDELNKSVWTMKNTFDRYIVLPLGRANIEYCPAWTESGEANKDTELRKTETIMGHGKEFKGFTHNRIKLSLKIGGLTKDSASFYILNVAGRGMNGDTIVNTEDPSYVSTIRSVDEDKTGSTKAEPPVANVGMEYPFYDGVEFYDFYDGVLPYSVYVKEPCATAFGATPVEKFIPQKEGYYTLKYAAKNSANHEIYKEYTVYAQYAVDDIVINLDLPTDLTFGLGETVPVQSWVTGYSGGSGTLETQTVVTRLADGKQIPLENGAFIPMLTGSYAVTYSATDFLHRNAAKTVVLTAVSENMPVLASELHMYEKLVSGEPVQLPDLAAYDYDTSPGLRLNAVTEIEVSGTGAKADVTEKLTGRIFTPTIEKFGNEIKIVYKTYCGSNRAVSIEHEFTVALIEPDYIWEYFIAGDNVQIGYNTEAEQNEQNNQMKSYVSFKSNIAQAEASMQFINPLPAENFDIQFGVAKADYTTTGDFTALLLRLHDYDDYAKCYEVRVEYKDDKETYVYYGDADPAVISGALNGKSMLQLGVRDGKLVDYGKNVLFDFGENAFPSKRLWAEIIMEDAQPNAEIRLGKIGTQVLRVSYNAEHQMRKFAYTVAPLIEADNFNDAYTLGETFTVPHAKAYDMFTLYVDVTYTLRDPDGNVLAANRSVNGNDTYVLNKYGRYLFTLTATNTNGIQRTLQRSLNVFDRTAPIIVYTGATEMSVKVGEAVTFEPIVVYDSVDENASYRLFVIEKNQAYKNITDSRTYMFHAAGVYKVRYIAYDASDNITVKEITVTVK